MGYDWTAYVGWFTRHPSFGQLSLVGFPSFHVISALLSIWLIWPLRSWRWFILPINIIMIAATPVVGGHCLTDVIAGAAVAFVGVALVNRIYPALAARCGTDFQIADASHEPGIVLGPALQRISGMISNFHLRSRFGRIR